MTTRRSFMVRAALTGGALVLPSGLLTTVGGGCSSDVKRRTDHYFVFYFMMGGWDLMLHTDPVEQKPGLWVTVDDADVFNAGPYRFGPALKKLSDYFDRTAILRGIYCDALNHPQARFRMCTGHFKPPGVALPGVPSVQALLAEKFGGAYDIPNLSGDALRPSVFRGPEQDERFEPVRVSSVDQLRALVGWDGPVSRARRDVEAAIAERDAQFLARVGDVSPLAVTANKYGALARAALDGPMREQLKAAGQLAPDVDRNAKAVKLAVEAIKQDLAPVITIGSGEFDSHTKSQYRGHPSAVMRGFDAVANIADGLDAHRLDDGTSLLDRTTIVVTSEFSRAPQKNELGGKHHWPANSMIFIGKGVKRSATKVPRVYGECDGGLNPVAVSGRGNPRTEEFIEMSHGLATVLAMGGIDPQPLLKTDGVHQLIG